MTASARDAVDNRVLDEASARGESYDIACPVAAPGAGFTSPDVAASHLLTLLGGDWSGACPIA